VETVLVLAERHGAGGGVCRPTHALLTLARRLGTPAAVLCGPADTASIEALGRFGAQAIWTVEASEVDDYPATARVEALVRLADQICPSCILVASGRGGEEIAARVAARLDSGVLTGAVDMWMGPDGPVVVQRVLDGSYLVESSVVRGITICTVFTEAVSPQPSAAEPAVRSLDLAFPQGMQAARLVSREPRGRPDPTAAAVVVAGGRGLGSRDGFELVERIAGALGGAACGSHTAAELGWCPRHQTVDQIGKAVHPLLYLALGVSGSVRHRAGMHGAQTVVAIDRDPEAPIFGVADLGVVGDVHEVAKELLTEIRRRRHGERLEWEA